MLARTAAGGLQFLESVHLPKATLKVSCDHDMSHDCHMTPTPGRAMVQQMIKRSKYKEILQKELEGRKLGVSKLGMEYHIHDLIGAELVEM